MNSLTPRSALPVAASIAAAFFLASAMAHVVVVRAPGASHPIDLSVLHAEIQACEADGDRTRDECLDEIEGKALIQRAEWLTQSGAGAETDMEADGDVAPVDATDVGSEAAPRVPRESAR